MKRILSSNLIFLGAGMSFLLTDIAPIHSQNSPQLTSNQSGVQILSQSPGCPMDQQNYRPPAKAGYVY
ncbi:MAG: hypothetical protein ACKPH1_07195, partial [Microcystis panniformis]